MASLKSDKLYHQLKGKVKFKEELLCKSGLCKKKGTMIYLIAKANRYGIWLGEDEVWRFCKEHYEEFHDHAGTYFEGDFEPRKWGKDDD